MKTFFKVSLLSLALAAAFMSCREEEEKTTDVIIEDGQEVKIKDDKVKIENADGSEVKIKYDENGNVEKIKTDDNE